MSDFDTRVMRWLQTANINGSEKKDVLANGIGGVDKYMRMDTEGSFESGSVDVRETLSWGCREEMLREVQKVDRDLHDDPEINYSEKLTDIQAIMNTLGPNSCGVAWLRDDDTLRFQLSVKKLPFYMVNCMPSPDLPVRVFGLIRLGILILEYKSETEGYEEMINHVSPIEQGESVPCPLFREWPHPLREYKKRSVPESEPFHLSFASHNAVAVPAAEILTGTNDDDDDEDDGGRWVTSSEQIPSPAFQSSRRSSHLLDTTAASIPRSPTYDPIYGTSSSFEIPRSPNSPGSTMISSGGFGIAGGKKSPFDEVTRSKNNYSKQPPTSPNVSYGSNGFVVSPRQRNNYPPPGWEGRRGPSKPPPSDRRPSLNISSSSMTRAQNSMGMSSTSFGVGDSSVSASSIPRHYNYKNITAREHAQYGGISMATMFSASDSTLPEASSPPLV